MNTFQHDVQQYFPNQVGWNEQKSKILSSGDERICLNHIRDESGYLFAAGSSSKCSVEINIVAPAANNSNTLENSMVLDGFSCNTGMMACLGSSSFAQELTVESVHLEGGSL